MIGLVAAKGFAAALGGAFATIFIVMLSLATMAPAIASMLFVPLFARWPALQHSSGRALVTGAFVCVVSALVVWAIALAVANTLVRLDELSPMMPFVAALTVGAATGFQLYHRKSFTRPRAMAIAGAVLVPIVFFSAMMV